MAPMSESDVKKLFPNYEEKKYKIEKLPDGSIKVTPPRSNFQLILHIITAIIIIGLVIILLWSSWFISQNKGK